MGTTFTHKDSYAHVPGYAEINFQQGLDGDGWVLDGDATDKASGRLVYRRGEEWATVPNMPYNQPAEWRVDALNWQADRAAARATFWEGEAAREPHRAWLHNMQARDAHRLAERLRDDARHMLRYGNGRSLR